eukprot:PhM_4_TR11060/c0_g1_i1/m.90721
MDDRHRALLSQVEDLRRTITELARESSASPPRPQITNNNSNNNLTSASHNSSAKQSSRIGDGGVVGTWSQPYHSPQHQQQPPTESLSPAPASPSPARNFNGSVVSGVGLIGSQVKQQQQQQQQPYVRVQGEGGAPSHTVLWSEYQQLLKIANDHVALLRQLYGARDGDADWTSIYWDVKQGLSTEECRAVSAVEFRDGLRLFAVPRQPPHRQFVGNGAVVSLIYDRLVVSVNNTLFLDVDVRHVSHVEHDAQERVLRIGAAVHADEFGALLGVELECFDQSVLRSLHHCISLRKDQIQNGAGGDNTSPRNPVPKIEALIKNTTPPTAQLPAPPVSGGGGGVQQRGFFSDLLDAAGDAVSELLGEESHHQHNHNQHFDPHRQYAAVSHPQSFPTHHQSAHQQEQRPASRMSKALLIGINYFGTNAELKGCINDVHSMQRFLLQSGFEGTFRVLTDDQQDWTSTPTKRNIIEAMRWLIDGAVDGDALFMHYSGHGTSVPDRDGDEDDGKDEALVPSDYKTSGLIVDDDIYDIVVEGLAPGVRLTIICDCCHSGTMIDLPKKVLVSKHNDTVSFQDCGNNDARFMRHHDVGEVVMLSGCRDDQTSADVAGAGALTTAFLQTMLPEVGRAGATFTYTPFSRLLLTVRDRLVQRLGPQCQVPQLTCNFAIDVRQPFSFGTQQ